MSRLLFLTLILLCAGSTNLLAQKAKFKSKVVSVQQARLPVNLTPTDKRTYDILAKGRYSEEVEAHGKKVYGWEKNTETPNMKAVVSVYGFSISSPKRHSEKKQTKDKDGKVTKSWTEYWYTASATGKGTLYIYGHSDPFQYVSPRKKLSKAQEKANAKAEAAEQDLADNPFLTDDIAVEEGEDDEGTDEGLTGDDLPLIKTIKLDQVTSVSSARAKSSSAAYKDYSENKRSKLTDRRSTFAQDVYKSAMNNLNAQYGFAPVNNRFYMKEMKSEKHPEFKTWNDACQAVKAIFKTHTFSQPIDASKFDPIIAYFEGQVNGISASDKKAKKHRKAAYQNLLNIYYYLDRHDDVITWSEQNMEDKNLDNLSKQMVKKSDRQKALLAFHGMSTCHFETEDVVDSDDIEDSELSADAEDGGKK